MPRDVQQGRGEVLICFGSRAVRFGIAALSFGFFLESAGTQAGPAEPRLLGPGISVFGTIHSDIFRLPLPLGAVPPAEGIRVASLNPQVGLDRQSNASDRVADGPASAFRNASLDERFAALNDLRRLSTHALPWPTPYRPTKASGRAYRSTRSACGCLRFRTSQNSEPIRRRDSAFPQRTFLPTDRVKSWTRRSMMAGPRSTISPRVQFICRAAAGWKPIPVLESSWTTLVM